MYFEFDSDSDQKEQDSPQDSNDLQLRTSAKNTTLSPTIRNRRYSIHSEMPSRMIDIGQKVTSGPNCDLALLARKKLDQVDEALTHNDIYEPDIKISKGTKHSSTDLRKEVLLHSMQRSLSMSHEDLSCFKNSFSSNDSGLGTSRGQEITAKNSFPSNFRFGSDMEILREDSIGDLSSLSGNSYKPPENQVLNNSKMIYTTTNSLAGSRLSENRLNYLAKRQNSRSLSSSILSSSSSSWAFSPPSSSNQKCPQRESNSNCWDGLSLNSPNSLNLPYPDLHSRTVLTHCSMSSSLKKRCHSSPTKYHAHSPYHTSAGAGGHLNCLVSTLTLSRDHNTPLFSTGTFSPPPDPTNKKFKGSPQVQLPKLTIYGSTIQTPCVSLAINSSQSLKDSQTLELICSDSPQNAVSSTLSTSFPSSSSSSAVFVPTTIPSSDLSKSSPKNDKELGQLTQDFDRLKTPFQ